MDMTSEHRSARPGYGQWFATSPSPLGRFLATRGTDPGSLPDLSSGERTCVIASAGQLLGWPPEFVRERLREWVPEANETAEVSYPVSLSRDRALLGLPGKGQVETHDKPRSPCVTASEWTSLSHASRKAAAAGPLTFALGCCGLLYRCPCPIVEAGCCPRCRPLFQPSVRVYGPGEYVIDDIIRAGVSELLGQLAAQSDSGLTALAERLTQAVGAAVAAAANHITQALPGLPRELQAKFVSTVEEIGLGNRLPGGDTLGRIVDVRRQLVQKFPEALTAGRSGQGPAFLHSLMAIVSSLILLERASECPTLESLRTRVQDITRLIDSGQLSTRSVTALIKSSQTLPAVESQGSTSLRTVLTLSTAPLLKLLAPKLAPLVAIPVGEAVTRSFLELDGEKLGRRLDAGIAGDPARGEPRSIAARLGCRPERVRQVLERMRSQGAAEPPHPPRPTSRRKALSAEEQARKEADRAARARHREQARAAKAATDHLAMLVTRFQRKQSLDFHEAQQFLDPLGDARPDVAASPIPLGSSLVFLPPATLETFDDQLHLSIAGGPAAFDRCWQQALREVHFGASRPGCPPEDEQAIRDAKHTIRQLNQGLAGRQTPPHQAYRIRLTPAQRLIVEAQLLASELPEAIDRSWQLPPGKARLYRDLFFNWGRSQDIERASDWRRFIVLWEHELGPLEGYLKRSALRGASDLRAAIGHLQRVQPLLIPLPGTPLPITDAEFLKAEFRWVRHCHPTLPGGLKDRFLKLLDKFRLAGEGARSRSRPRVARSRPDRFSDSAAPGPASPPTEDSWSPNGVTGLEESDDGVELDWSLDSETPLAGFHVLSARGPSL